jgi:glycerol-3-phosphate dehydrogenase
MQRDLNTLTTRVFDVVIVGGGIYGACLARAAARDGLAVALLEQGDFGGATSANSQRILHGGFRYLQHGDLRRVRESLRARRCFLRAAPHLAHPLPVLIPTHRRGLQRRGLLRAALALYDGLAWDRNRGIRDPQQRIPRSRVLSRAECLQRLPGLRPEGVTGGAVWHDGQVCHAERLTLAFVQSAVAAGAVAANYVRVTGFVQEPGRVAGVRAADALTGRPLIVHGRLTVTTAGPWVNQVLGLTQERVQVPLALSKTLCVTVKRPLANGYAVSVARTGADGRERRLFLTPWRDAALVGSGHTLAGEADSPSATEAEIRELLEAANAAYPGARLRREDITDVCVGLLPRETRGGDTDPSHLTGRYQVVDHAREHGVEGLLSVVSVKYTVACTVAERTLRVALRKLGRRPRGRRAEEPVWGGAFARLEDVTAGALAEYGERLGAPVARELTHLYGTHYRDVAALAEADARLAAPLGPGTLTIGAQVVYAVREEMAQTLADVVRRRTALGALGHPGDRALRACADLMAQLCGWDARRTAEELAAVERLFAAAAASAREAATT